MKRQDERKKQIRWLDVSQLVSGGLQVVYHKRERLICHAESANIIIL